MLRKLVLVALVTALLPLFVQLPGQAADAPRTVSVSGNGVGMYPAFDPSVERYALTTTDATAGEVTFAASTTDPDTKISLNGRPFTGSATVRGLTPADEVSLIFEDSTGSSVHSFVYLPAGFPTLTEVVPAGSGASGTEVLVNLSRYANDGSPNFEAALDHHGVPRHVQAFPSNVRSGDLKQDGPDGHYTVFRSPTTTPGRLGNQLIELDEQFREVRRYETQGGLVQTDGHDSLLRPDGSRILLAYEPNSTTGLEDAVIQEIDAQGEVVYTWNSAEHMDPDAETTSPNSSDYAHINSIDVTEDGNILASFRHLSSVLKIAWRDQGTFERGDIMWRLGGRASDFTFVDDPLEGPCAQHTAAELDNGNILIYDNGSIDFGADPSHCVDPEDPTGPTHERRQSRATEYALDEDNGTATLVWSYQKDGWFSYFAGSARRMANGNTMLGWAADRRAIASEVDPDGNLVWELKNDAGYLSYRVTPAVVPDRISPVVTVHAPADGATYTAGQRVPVNATCTDRGGSSLRACTAPATLDTGSVGQRSYQVVGKDGAGNTTTLTRRFNVVAPTVRRADLIVRVAGGRWVGNNVYGGTRQRVVQKFPRDRAVRTSLVRLQNEGNRTDSFTIRATPGNRRFAVRYVLGGRDVTSAVVNGRLTRRMAARHYVDLTLRVTRLRPASPGHARTFAVRAVSKANVRANDVVSVLARATRK